MVSGEKILSFGLSVVWLIFALKASSFAQGRPAKVYVSHAAATLTDVPYYIAREKKFYLDEGLDVTSIFVQGRALSIQVLTAGSVDFSFAVGSGTRIDSFQKKLAIFAGIDPLLFQGSIDNRALVKFKGSLNRALIGAAPNQRLVRTFSKYQLQRTEDNRFSGTRFSCYDGEARCQIPVQRLDKSKVPDS